MAGEGKGAELLGKGDTYFCRGVVPVQAGLPAVQLPGLVCVVREERGWCLLTQDGRFLFCCGNWLAGPEKVQVPAQRGTLISGTMAAAESLSPGAGKNCIWPKSLESTAPASVNTMWNLFWFRSDIQGKWLSLAVLHFVPHAANVMFLLNANSCW